MEMIMARSFPEKGEFLEVPYLEAPFLEVPLRESPLLESPLLEVTFLRQFLEPSF
jgi:hypothetical protein